ncbi:hypothetical protein D9758_009686 [Tetrapyrgos nigripes]|uniref:Uncharacterized protein n=1 Tax=Tetrapyrgos nigripes TaxID=182062 RepID=A0A8H5CPS3_9AGAR|nr:hypothetical protein D9758_009686 [Tetrapyrgos nigripes]
MSPLRLLAQSSLLVNVCTQLYMIAAESSSSTLPPAYAPHPVLFYTAILFQWLLQLCWLVIPIDIDTEAQAFPSSPSASASPKPMTDAYIPYCIAGNISMAIWTYTYYYFSHLSLSLAQLVLYINILIQLYAVFFQSLQCPVAPVQENENLQDYSYSDSEEEDKQPLLAPVPPTTSLSLSPQLTPTSTSTSTYPQSQSWISIPTDNPTLIPKLFIGLSVMYLWKTWGHVETTTWPTYTSAHGYAQLLNVILPLIFLTIASGPDPTLGISFVYMFLALYLGSGPAVCSSSTSIETNGHPFPFNFFLASALILLIVVGLDYFLPHTTSPSLAALSKLSNSTINSANPRCPMLNFQTFQILFPLDRSHTPCTHYYV